MLLSALILACATSAWPAHQASPAGVTGIVTFHARPVPGATVTASRADEHVVTTTNAEGTYRLAVGAGVWTLRVEMRGFVPIEREVAAEPGGMPATWVLTMVPAESFTPDTFGAASPADVTAPSAPAVAVGTDADTAGPDGADGPDRAPDTGGAVDGLLVTGSVNNGAATPFAQSPAFGNNRPGVGWLYSGAAALVVGDSAWDARPFSFSKTEAARPDYTNADFSATFAGPLPLPRLSRLGTTFLVGYQRARANRVNSSVVRVPTTRERTGDFSETLDGNGQPVVIRDPASGQPFARNVIPPDQLSPQARTLLALYPVPNVEGSGLGNYQAAVVDRSARDAAQVRVTQPIGARNRISGSIEYLRSTATATGLFAFTDRVRSTDLGAGANWTLRLSRFLFLSSTYGFRRTTIEGSPFFAHRTNISGDAGIVGNDQRPGSWGPPALVFATGLVALADAGPASSSTRSQAWGSEMTWSRTRHVLTFGGDLRRVLVDVDSPDNPRGSLLFTGDATGLDLADFLVGLPHSSALGFDESGRAFHGWSADAYFTDDWRIWPGLTVNLGVRWEYEGPLAERYGRLSNLTVDADFRSAMEVVGGSLLAADRLGLQPRLGASWRPIAGSSLVIRGGYGLYRSTNVYLPIARLLSSQPPYSTGINRETTPDSPLALQAPFGTEAGTARTFAIDPAFRVGFSETWQLSAQRDLPASLTVLVTYLGVRGHRLPQAFLPNSYPPGGVDPCPACPAGFVYVESSGSSSKHAVQLHLRRRLRAGFSASLQYTLATAMDDAPALAGVSTAATALAQDWRDLGAEWAPSNFDQRHLVVADVEYTTGVGLTGGALLDGTGGALFKGWTFAGQLTAGSGLPVTPRYLTAVPGTAVTGTVRASVVDTADRTPDGLYLNPAAYAMPAPGTWGTAGRNSARGPGTFSLDATLARSFTLPKHVTLEWRLEAINVLNRVTYSSVNTIVGGQQFGRPDRANAMRTIRMTTRVSF